MNSPGTRAPTSLCAAIFLGVSLVSACASTGPRRAGASSLRSEPAPDALAPVPAGLAPATVYVARRRWHIDVGFAADDLHGSLAAVARPFPGARYVFFGFGDRHYLMSKDHEAPNLLAALWPGPGLILVTVLDGSPAEAFGAQHVVKLTLTPAQSSAIQGFIRRSISSPTSGSANWGEDPEPVAQGPYAGSVYFAAVPRYSGLHTCITWAAETLRAGGLPVRSRLTLIASQLWHQVLKLRASPAAEGSIAGRRVAVLAYHGRRAALRDHDRRLGGRRRAAAADTTG